MLGSGPHLVGSSYRLTTAEITYHMPDYPELLQSYVWQGFDVVPQLPKLLRFLDFWQGNLDGRLHSVRVASSRLVTPARFRYANCLITVQ